MDRGVPEAANWDAEQYTTQDGPETVDNNHRQYPFHDNYEPGLGKEAKVEEEYRDLCQDEAQVIEEDGPP